MELTLLAVTLLLLTVVSVAFSEQFTLTVLDTEPAWITSTVKSNEAPVPLATESICQTLVSLFQEPTPEAPVTTTKSGKRSITLTSVASDKPLLKK